MHDDRHSERADDQYQHFRLHFETPVWSAYCPNGAIPRFVRGFLSGIHLR
jgi:hypothetical protein